MNFPYPRKRIEGLLFPSLECKVFEEVWCCQRLICITEKRRLKQRTFANTYCLVFEKHEMEHLNACITSLSSLLHLKAAYQGSYFKEFWKVNYKKGRCVLRDQKEYFNCLLQQPDFLSMSYTLTSTHHIAFTPVDAWNVLLEYLVFLRLICFKKSRILASAMMTMLSNALHLCTALNEKWGDLANCEQYDRRQTTVILGIQAKSGLLDRKRRK